MPERTNPASSPADTQGDCPLTNMTTTTPPYTDHPSVTVGSAGAPSRGVAAWAALAGWEGSRASNVWEGSLTSRLCEGAVTR